MAYKRDPITDKESLKTLRLSPSSINTFNNCELKWYYQYILAKTTNPTIPLIRGTVVHYVLENMFKHRFVPSGEAFRPFMIDGAKKMLNKQWDIEFKDAAFNKEDLDLAKEESHIMVERFFKRFCDNVQLGIKFKKYQNETQGYYYTKPKFKELWLDDQFQATFNEKWKRIDKKTDKKIPLDDSLILGGWIDAVDKDFDGNIILVDYKTSSLYRNAINDDYVLQLAIYAYLWWKQTGKIPTYGAINYLKYDQSFYILVTPSLIQKAITAVKRVRSRLIENGLNEKKYMKNETRLCEWCSFKNECMRRDLNE